MKKQNNFLKFLAALVFIIATLNTITYGKSPKLTVVFVIDQFAYHYFEKIEPHLTGGIKFLLNNGIVYKNAYFPHANPATSPGHVAINTGTYAKDHGIIGNKWIDQNGNKINYEFDDLQTTKEFLSNNNSSPGKYEKYGKSGKNIMVDGISDQFARHSKPFENHKVFALSYKSRAAIGLAGKLGKAIWFDNNQFTTSKAYFQSPPEWLLQFNQKYNTPNIPQKLHWKLFYPRQSPAYNFYNITNYDFSHLKFSLIDKPFSTLHNDTNDSLEKLFLKTPHSNQHILDLAKECLNNNLSPNKNDKFLLWISMSSLDRLGHYYGPDSIEILDMIYHLDFQLKHFIRYVNKKIKPEKVLLVLTADHGVMPINEISQQQGLSIAHRLNEKLLKKHMNQLIQKTYGIDNIIKSFRSPQFYVNKQIFSKLNKIIQQKILTTLKLFLKKQPGIQNVWTYDELNNATFEPYSIDSFYKNQLYPERSGELTCKFGPYSAITKYPTGTHHRTPYEYDTHVPLIIYQQEKFEKEIVEEKVWMLQLANTLAQIYNIAKPAASTFNPLPKI